jgi:hypothetical protein
MKLRSKITEDTVLTEAKAAEEKRKKTLKSTPPAYLDAIYAVFGISVGG